MEIAFAKAGGLVPAIVQDDRTGDVLMLGFMNEDALAKRDVPAKWSSTAGRAIASGKKANRAVTC